MAPDKNTGEGYRHSPQNHNQTNELVRLVQIIAHYLSQSVSSCRNLLSIPPSKGAYFSCGSLMGTEILRYKDRKGEISGIISRAQGLLLTANHVVTANRLDGFHVKDDRCTEFDFNWKNDPESRGPPIGAIRKPYLDNVTVVTSRIEDPSKLIAVPGKLGIFLGPTSLMKFTPSDPQHYTLFVPGASGSPVMYQGRIIGVIPFSSVPEGGFDIGACIFGPSTIKPLQELGLKIEIIEE